MHRHHRFEDRCEGRRGQHRFMRGHFGHHPGRGRGGGRFFDQGDLRLVILSLLAEAPSHGYQLIKTLEERTGGAYAPSPGVVYPTLTLLEEQGFIAQSGSDGARKLYEATNEGRAELAANQRSVDAIAAKFQHDGGRHSSRSPRLMRAQDNLRSALKTKLMQGALTEAQTDAVVAALDAAARAIDEA